MKFDKNQIIYQAKLPGLPKSEVQINLSPEFNRVSTNDGIEAELEKKWKMQTAANPRLYGQSKFRFHSLVQRDSGILELNCGLSSYKDFVGTNLNPTVVELAEDHSYLADIIGVNGILRTSDGFCVITKRAAWVGEHPGMLDTPGGHPEPAKLSPNFDLKNVNDADHATIFARVSELDPVACVNELFDSQADEMALEFNISPEDLSEPRLYSIGRIKSGAGRVVVYFLIETTVTKGQLLESWSRGGAETDESASVQFLPFAQLAAAYKEDAVYEKLSDNGIVSIETFLASNLK